MSLLSWIQAWIHIIFSTSGYRPPIFDSPLMLHLTGPSVHASPTMFLDLIIDDFRWKFADISFVSWHPSYIRYVYRPSLWIFIGVAYTMRTPKAPKEKCLGSPTDRWKPHQKCPVPEMQGAAAFAAPRCYVTTNRAAVRGLNGAAFK